MNQEYLGALPMFTKTWENLNQEQFDVSLWDMQMKKKGIYVL